MPRNKFFISKHFPQIEQIRTIGKIILRALESLQYKILNLERFENQKGLSYYFIVNISKQQNDEDNFIFDFGIEQNKNRVSIFLNNNDQICLRFIDNEEKVYKIFLNADLFYDRDTCLNFQLGFFENEILLSIGDKNYTKYLIYQGTSDLSFLQNFHYVLGSDYKGEKLTNIMIMEIMGFSRILKLEEKYGLWNYFLENMKNDKYNLGRAKFQSNQFMYSQDHPNFPITD